MRGVEQDQTPFYCSSESKSELFTCGWLQLQLYTTSESIRVFTLHLVSVQEVKGRSMFCLILLISMIVVKTNWDGVWNISLGVANRMFRESYWRGWTVLGDLFDISKDMSHCQMKKGVNFHTQEMMFLASSGNMHWICIEFLREVHWQVSLK